MEYEAQVLEAVEFLKEKFGSAPEVGVVLGSGLGDFADGLDGSLACSNQQIPHWPRSTAPGHLGRVVVGHVGSKAIVALQGRVHYYESGDMRITTFPIRVLGAWGVKTLILTNASGGIREDLRPGTLVVLRDHINLMGTNPLIGPNCSHWGPRFPDMTCLYDQDLQNVFLTKAKELQLPVEQGCYVAFSGPSYETPAEIKMMRSLGADVVGMSSVPEAIVARHMGLKVACISCVANAAAGVTGLELTEKEVLDQMALTGKSVTKLLKEVICLL